MTAAHQTSLDISATRPAAPASNWSLHHTVNTVILLALAAGAPLATYIGATFWVDILTRLVILSIAATGLNLILGYGGMVSFGHAAFIGLGAYAVGIPAYHVLYGGAESIATNNGFAHLAMALVVCGIFALITGAICLRTRGVYFIMITMAFGQMIYFAIVSMQTYGGDDGLTIDTRSEFYLLSLDKPLVMYAVCFTSLLVVLYLVHRLTHSRFGMVLRAAQQNEERVRALGVNPYIYKLTAYVLSGVICGYAGFLLGNFTTFISPEMMDWTRSGELMFMVILGGAAYLFGPIIGVAVFLVLEQTLSGVMTHWHLPFGILLILTVLFVKGGLSGIIERLAGKHA
jgi:branched-chain amino acid transport system permease protein